MAIYSAIAHSYVHRQGTQLTTLVAWFARDGVLGIDVNHRGIFALLHQYGVGVVGADAVGQQHPLEHLALAIGTCGPPTCQLAVAVEQVAEELEALQKAVFGTQGAVVSDTFGLHVWGFQTEIVVITHASIACIRDDCAAIDGGYCGTTCDVAIEHAVHHHGLLVVVGRSRSLIIVTNNTSNIGSSRDIGIAVTIDNTSCPVEQAHQASRVARTTYRAREDANIIDAG